MKRLHILYLIGLLLFILSSCEKKDDLIVDSPQIKSNLKSMTTDIDDCIYSPTVFDLLAGQHMIVGQVTVVNDEENLFVTYETTGEWLLQEVHIFAGDLGDLPLNNKNTPVPGHFPYSDDELYVTSYTYVIPLSEIGMDCFYIFTHAVVVKEEMNDVGGMILTDETSWGCGDYDFNETFGTSRWGCFGEYCVEECVEENFLTFKIFTTDNNWSILTAGEQLYSSGWCQPMGVVIPEDGDSYNLEIAGSVFAVAQVSIVENNLIINITSVDGITELWHTYLFYGTKAELAEYGECPTYGNFPYTVHEIGETHEIVIPF